MKARLVISHASGDEGYEYETRIREFADLLGAQVNFVSDIIQERRGQTADGRKIYSLADVYQKSDLVTYPSTIEGFGNAFLETIYYRRPIVVNNYSIFAIDIKPKGFKVIDFDGYITNKTVENTEEILQNSAMREQMTEFNYNLAKRYYSYTMLSRHLSILISDCFGEEIPDES